MGTWMSKVDECEQQSYYCIDIPSTHIHPAYALPMPVIERMGLTAELLYVCLFGDNVEFTSVGRRRSML